MCWNTSNFLIGITPWSITINRYFNNEIIQLINLSTSNYYKQPKILRLQSHPIAQHTEQGSEKVTTWPATAITRSYCMLRISTREKKYYILPTCERSLWNGVLRTALYIILFTKCIFADEWSFDCLRLAEVNLSGTKMEKEISLLILIKGNWSLKFPFYIWKCRIELNLLTIVIVASAHKFK